MTIRPEVYDTYWYFAAERQGIFYKKLSGAEPPFTSDPIFQEYKFCNTYRASDRVSQFMIKRIIYSDNYNPADIVLRVIFFRLLNKIETWQHLEAKVGPITYATFNQKLYSRALAEIKKEYGTIYGNAFILSASRSFGYQRKHDNHLALVKTILQPTNLTTIVGSPSLERLFWNLRQFPLIGDFMAYQIAIDLNYSPLFNFSENDFTIAGPGALRGIAKCFTDIGAKSPEYIIMSMVEQQQQEFERLGLNFQDLGGRALHAIDCQGLFCETDKYCRVQFPELKSERVRIKTKYSPTPEPIEYFYPPKWQIKKLGHE